MSNTIRMGVVDRSDAGPDHPVDRAVWAEARGYDSIWLTDGGGRMDAMTLAAAIAMKTEAIRLCMGIVPVYTRSPATFATTGMSLSRLAPGRVVMGLGSSHPNMVQDWYGFPFEKPMARMREVTVALRQMLAGEPVDLDGETINTHGFKLAVPTEGTVPVYISALRPKMLELAGEVADGVILNLTPLSAMPRIMESIDVGAKRSGRRAEDLEIVCLFNTFVTTDVQAAENQFRKIASFYFRWPAYNAYLAWCGHKKAAAEIMAAHAAGDRAGAVAAVSEEMPHELAIIGTAEQCKAELQKFADAGLNTAAIASGWPKRAEADAIYEALAPNAG